MTYNRKMYKQERPTIREERGTAAMEFAVLLPVFLMLVLGIMYFGMGFNAKINMTAAVREGARTLALGGEASEGRSRVLAASSGIGLEATDVDVVKTCEGNEQNAVITATRPLQYNLFFTHGTWTITATGVMQCEAWRQSST